MKQSSKYHFILLFIFQAASSINASFSGSLPNHYIIILLLHVHVMYDLCSCVCNGRIMCNSWENKLLLLLLLNDDDDIKMKSVK